MTKKQTKEPTPADKLNAIGIEAICKSIAEGASLREWCRKNSFALTTVHDWIDSNEERAEQYARAREDRADAKFEMLEEIGEKAATAESAVEVAGLRLKSDNLKWMLARMNAKKYGEKVQQEVTGANGAALVLQLTNADASL